MTAEELEQLKTMRWLARTDLQWLCNNVLGYKLVNRQIHGGLIDKLQQFPRPTPEQFDANDRLVGNKWYYTPVVPLDDLVNSKRTLILDSRGFAKCVVPGQLCRTSDGSYKKAEDIVPGDTLFGIDENTFEPSRATVQEVEEQTPQPCFRITFDSGRQVEVSHEHPFKTVTGWVDAKDLTPQDYVAQLGHAEEPAGASYTPDADLLGWLTGDGSFSNMIVTNESPVLRKQIIAAAKKAGGSGWETFPKHRTAGVRIQGFRPRAQELGLLDATSGDKFVPDHIFKADNKSVAEFLHAYLMCDGSLNKSGMSYVTKSERLARDIQRLFLRFNLPVHLAARTVTTGPYKGYIYWHGMITSVPMIDRLLSFISWDKPSTWVRAEKTNPNKNVVPKAWRTLYPKYFFDRGEKPQWLKDKYQVTRGRVGVAKSLSTYGGRKEYLNDVGTALNDVRLQNLGSDKIFWDKVVSVEPLGDRVTFAIQTDIQNFAIDDIVTHNTTINTLAHTIQWIINYPDITIMIVQSNLEKAILFLKEVKAHFIGNPIFRKLFPEHVPQKKTLDWGTQTQFTSEARSKESTRREPTVMTASIDKGVAGIHVQVMKFSDIVEENNSADDIQAERVYYNFNSMLNLLDSPIYWVDLEGTRYNHRDCYGQIIDKEMDVPKHEREWDFYINGCFERVAHGPRDYGPEELDLPFAKDEKGNYISRWPDRFPLKNLLQQQKNDPRIFSCQQLNAPVMSADGRAQFPTSPESHLPVWVKRHDFTTNVNIAYREIIVDTAETNNKRSDFSAISVGGWDLDGRLYIEQIYHGKWLPDELIRVLVGAIKTHRPRYVGIEETSFVRGLKGSLGREMAKSGLYIPIRFIKRDTQIAKTERILNTLQPWYKNGWIRFLDDIMPKQELLRELDRFGAGGHDDILDTLADFFQNKEYFGREGDRPASPEDAETRKQRLFERASARDHAILTGAVEPSVESLERHSIRPGQTGII